MRALLAHFPGYVIGTLGTSNGIDELIRNAKDSCVLIRQLYKLLQACFIQNFFPRRIKRQDCMKCFFKPWEMGPKHWIEAKFSKHWAAQGRHKSLD